MMSKPTVYASELLTPSVFIERVGRFSVLVELELQGQLRRVKVYLANPGRMHEMLLPGVVMHLAPRPGRSLAWEVLALSWSQRWPGDQPRVVFVNAAKLNDVAEVLLRQRRIPSLSEYEIEQREVTLQHRDGGPQSSSRIDFLLRKTSGERRLLELKSVTLVEHGLAMFPDAQTARALRHVEALRQAKLPATLLFLIQGQAERFSPDLHNDLALSRALFEARSELELLAVQVDVVLQPDEGTGLARCVLGASLRTLPIDWQGHPERLALQRGLEDRGCYLLVLQLGGEGVAGVSIWVGALGELTFEPGYYVYVGSARRALSARVARHLRRRKQFHWHIDYLREYARSIRAFPIRAVEAECALAAQLRALGPAVRGFGSSDCGCGGHLFAVGERDPVHGAAFQALLTRWRHGSEPR
ncbi:MAG: DNA/RNA nuclease SfsA [Myxococcota bacterium]|nr:DNA/RNA nuclease SfsA [Myxococcota bacterium]